MAAAVPAAAALGVSEIISIGSSIVTAVSMLTKAKEVHDKVVHPPSDQVKEKNYWLQITIVNKTQFPITLGDKPTYFYNGRYQKNPDRIEPFSKMTYEVCNEDAVFIDSGVAGGNTFKIWLDGNVTYDFATGWTCPVVGNYKAHVMEGSDPKKAYDDSTNAGAALTSSKAYSGVDAADSNKRAAIKFRLDCTPSQTPHFVVSQMRHTDGGWAIA